MSDETQKALHEAEWRETESGTEASNREFAAKMARDVHEKAKARADELRTKAEVEAFGHRFHAKLLAAMKRGSTNVVDMLGAAMEAAGVGATRPAPPGLETQEASVAKRLDEYRKASGTMDMLRGSSEKIAEPPALVGQTPREIREAALEQAAGVVGEELGMQNGWIQQRIRALKSKPTPDALPKQEDYCMECEKPKTAHGMSCSQDVRPRTHSNGCALDADHKGACFGLSLLEMERQEARMYQSPEPIHDFGWALAQMRAGKRVRRAGWTDGEAWSLARADDGSFWGRASIRQFHWEHVLATDWEVAP